MTAPAHHRTERGLLFRHLADVRREMPDATWEAMGREVRRRMPSESRVLRMGLDSGNT